jgi:hypothetical protein
MGLRTHCVLLERDDQNSHVRARRPQLGSRRACADCFDLDRSFSGLVSCDQQNAASVTRRGWARPDRAPLAQEKEKR